MGCCFSSSSGGPDKEIDEISLPEVFPYRVGGVNLDHSYSDRPWYKRFDLICPIIVILLFGLLVSWALITSETSSGSEGSKAFVAKLREDNIQLVIFDMDGTATHMRTEGTIRAYDHDAVYGSVPLKAFAASASRDFKEIVPILLKDGFNVGIATFSDKIFMYDHESDTDRTDTLAGKALVAEFLKGSFPDMDPEVRGSIGVVAQVTGRDTFARHRPTEHNKDVHIVVLCLDFKLENPQAVFFDDDIVNVNAAKKTPTSAYHVTGGRGFSYQHYIPASPGVHLQSTQPKAYLYLHDEAQQFILNLRDNGIELVLFDMDRTATRENVNGIMTTESSDINRSTELKKYVDSASVHFKYIVPILLKEGFHVAIVTFSDASYYGDEKDLPQSLAGEDLVNAFLEGVFPGLTDRDKIKMVCRNADYPPEKRNKNTHITDLASEVGDQSNAILFDDDLNNVVAANTDAKPYSAYQVTGRDGFEFRYFDDQYRETYLD
eukprot:265014_1